MSDLLWLSLEVIWSIGLAFGIAIALYWVIEGLHRFNDGFSQGKHHYCLAGLYVVTLIAIFHAFVLGPLWGILQLLMGVTYALVMLLDRLNLILNTLDPPGPDWDKKIKLPIQQGPPKL